MNRRALLSYPRALGDARPPGSPPGAEQEQAVGEKPGGGKSSGSKFSPSLEQVIQGVNRDLARGMWGREKTVPREQTNTQNVAPAATTNHHRGAPEQAQTWAEGSRKEIEQEPGARKGWTAAKGRGRRGVGEQVGQGPPGNWEGDTR